MQKYLLVSVIFCFLNIISNAQAPTSGLIAYYPFTNSSASDVSGNGRNGTVNGATPATDRYGNANACFKFDGIDDFIEIADHASLRGQNISFNLWVNPAAIGDMMFLGKSVAADATNEQYGFRFAPNQLMFSVKQNSACIPANGWSHNIADFNYAPHDWVMVTATFSGRTSRIFANGKLIKEEVFESSGIDQCTGGSLRLGIWWGGTLPFNGKLDDVRIYNRALTAQEVMNTYNAEKPPINIQSGLVAYYPFNGNANDESGNRSPGIMSGNASYTNGANGLANQALLLNGSSSFVDLGEGLNFNQSFTVSFLAKTITNPGGNPSIISQGIGELNQQMHIMLGPNYMRFAFYENTPLDCSQNFPGLNEWGHWVCTYDAGTSTRRMYLNGKLICSDTRPPVNSAGNTRIGTNTYDHPTNGFFHGAIDQVRIYNRALLANDVSALYQSEAPPIDTRSGLIAYYPFTSNSNDESGNGNHGSRNNVLLTADRNSQSNKAYSFNGNSSLITVSPSTSLNSIEEESDITISAWFWPNNWSKNGVFINKSGPADMHYRFYSTESALVLQLGNNAWSVGYPLPDENKWHQVAASKNGNSVTFYFNGQILGSTTPYHTGNTFNKDFPLEIGRDAHGPTEWSNGKIDEVRIYNRGLTSSEILAIYNGESPACENTSPNIISVNVASQTDIAGLLKITADAQVCPANNPFVKFKYWFNDDINNAKINVTNKTNYLHYPIKLDCLDLNEGEHVINFQFITENESTSIMVSRPFIRVPHTVSDNRNIPAVTVNPGNITPGDNIIVRGTGFIPNGLASLMIYGNNNEGILFEGDVAIDNLGKFEIQEVINDNAKTGKYTVVANDLNNNDRSVERTIFVNGVSKVEIGSIKIIEPSIEKKYPNGTMLTVSWQDATYINQNSPNSGSVSNSYLIEVKKNDEDWLPITTISRISAALSGIFRTYSINYILADVGNYKFRITDRNNSDRFIETKNIEALVNVARPFSVNFHWDKSGDYVKQMPLKGAVADGTARFLIEVRTFSPMPVNFVKIQLYDDVGSSTSQYLGKVYPATEFSQYSEEANTATDITAIQANAANQEKSRWYFWYVAPDDFLLPGDNREASERRVSFSVSLNNNSPIFGSFIEIVRPPLMMVHGLGGDAIKTWEYTRFNGNSGTIYFNNANALFKAGVVSASMHPTDCFVKNAKRLLNMFDNDCDSNSINQSSSVQPNSLISVIAQSISKGYACSRVDYVCHSMGGVMIRAAINGYEKFYLANSQSPSNFKNYGKGFVNKLITINTPHWGSPWADMADDIINAVYSLNEIERKQHVLVLSELNQSLDNDFIEFNPNSKLFEVNKAIENMQFFNGGISLGQSSIKNHVILGKLGEIPGILVADALEDEKPKLTNVIKLIDIYNPDYGVSKNLNRIFKTYYNFSENFIENSDLIVSFQSQKSIEFNRSGNSYTVFTGVNARHTGTTEKGRWFDLKNRYSWESIVSNDKVGDRVLDILNSPIASDVFADKLDANPSTKGISRLSDGNKSGSVKAKGAVILSGTKLQIDAPLNNDAFSGDSIFSVQASIKDTIGLRYLRLYFQGEFYYSSSKVLKHTFSLPIRSNLKERELIYLTGVYDSAGTVAYHTDTVGIIITGTPILTGISAFLDRSFISKGDTIIPFVDAITDRGVIRLSRLDSLVSISVLDTSIAKVSVSGNRIVVHSRRGSTRAVVTYNGFTDTIVLAHNDLDENLIQPTYCLGSENTLVARLNGAVNRQWQIDQGSGFENIVNDSRFDGVISDTLVILSADSSLFGKKIRCISSTEGNEISSQVFIIRFVNKWIGAVSDDWHEPGNWSCGNVPNEYTDVIISTKSIFLPRIRLNASVNSLELEDSAFLNIDEGINLEILSKEVNY
jgi:hypothetical protein